MTDRTMLARIATRAALQARRSLSIPRDQPVDAFDLAEALGVEVRFMDAPSLEGMFSRAPHPLILLPSLNHRPRGRLAYTCAHELGHAILGHGERVDKLVDEPHAQHDPEEFSADVFAGAILMPRPVVLSAFTRRGVDFPRVSTESLYAVSCELGVGFATLVTHIVYGLQMANPDWAKRMGSVTPKTIRQSMLGDSSSKMLLVDKHYSVTTLDLEVGELLAVDGARISTIHEGATELIVEERVVRDGITLYRAMRSGLADVDIERRSVRLRICRSGYVGPQRNRFLEDPEAE